MARFVASLLVSLLVAAGAAPAQDAPHATRRWQRPPAAVKAWLERRARAAPRESGAPSRLRRAAVGTARTLADPQFAAAIVLADLARAGARGDRDRAADALRAVDTYEFWTSVALFGTSMRAGEAVVGRLAARLPAAGTSGAAVTFLRHNLVLAGAMTVGRVVEVDFGGKRLSDLASGEVPDLSTIRIRLRGDVDGGEIAITLGSFAVAQPVWGLARARLVKLLRLPSNRFARASGRVLDLAALLLIAHELEEPVKEAYERWQSTQAVREAVADLLALMKRTRGAPEVKELDRALGDVARAFANHRDFVYLLPAVADAELIQRLTARGEPRQALVALEGLVLEEWGDWLALPGQTLALLSTYQARLAAGSVPGGDRGDFEGLLRRHLERVKGLVRRVKDAPRLPQDGLTSDAALARVRATPALERSILARYGSLEAWADETARKVEGGFDPTSPGFTPSRNREELYAQELALYRLLQLDSSDAAARARFLSEAAAVGALMGTEHELLQKILDFELPAAGMAGSLTPAEDDR